MSSVFRVRACVLAATLVAISSVQIAAQETKKGVIREIHFYGDDQLAHLNQSKFDSLHLEDFAGFSAVEELEGRVQYLYQCNGYYKAEVKAYPHPLTGTLDEQPLSVDVQIAQNLQYRLRRLEVTGQKAFSAEQLRTLFPIQSGEVFNVDQIREGLDNLRKLYNEHGYINFTPIPDTKTDDVQAVLDLSIDVDEGPQFRIGTIGFSGTGTRDSSFQDHILRSLKFRSGDVYNPRLLDEFFKQNRSWLPRDSLPEENMEIAQNTREHTVDLYFVFK